MNVSVYGTGYVGLVTGVCLAELGNQVVCVDIDANKIDQLQQNDIAIFEPGLDRLLQKNLALGRIHFTSDFSVAISHGLFQMIAVGTPAQDDGAADIRAVYDVAQRIGKSLQDYCLVITKSTVPVGTADEVKKIIQQQLAARGASVNFDIASNPEFLREGAAIEDFFKPDRVIVGTESTRALNYLRELYKPLIDAGIPFLEMDIRSSELTKYTCNAFLATKISFMNEMSHLADLLNADIEQVRNGMAHDPRIGEYFLHSGCGYGGSCFPKDVQALLSVAKQHNHHLRILSATQDVNEEQQFLLVKKLQQYFPEGLQNKTIALWGLAFKPNTNDMRGATSKVIIENLLSLGAKIQAYDPVAMEEAQALYGENLSFSVGKCHETVLENADALVIVTEWEVFKSPNFQLIKQKLRYPAIFDGRNIYEPIHLSALGLEYFAIGRRQTANASLLD